MGWIAMFVIGVLFMVMGIQGSLGRVLAVAFTPDLLTVTEG